MTNVELYDLALRKGVHEPAVFRHGEECILGLWMDTDQVSGAHDPRAIMHRSETRCVFVLMRASTWEECARKMGWPFGEPVTVTRAKTVKP